MRFGIVLLYIIVYLAIALPRMSALLPWYDDLEKSICTKVVTELTTFFVPYEETYVYGFMYHLYPQRGKRINYRLGHKQSNKFQDTCCEGYEIVMDRCTPLCFPNCVNGKCKAKNLCECSQGYKKISTNVCKPVCSNGCLNGDCVQPELCKCFPNYWLDSDGYTCRPACDENCESNQGYCLVPNTCICHDGYKKSNDSNICEPICEHECVNGTCIAPNTCKCDEGFVLQDDNITATTCKPFCASPCGSYAECTAPDHCTCKKGYRLVRKNDTADNVLDLKNATCIEVCKNDCINGKCVSPNVCVCEDGYDMALPNNSCQAICEKFCAANVKCDALNDCACNEDYHNMTTRKEQYVCQPFCEFDCEHGRCTEPNVCTCNMGYVRNERGRCVPVCYPPCTNGICTEPNICSCDKGFIQRNETVCEPFCENACINGTCVAPNTCQCNEDFVEMKSNNGSICIPACSRNCSGHGTCLDESNTCFCFYGWTGWDCDEIGVCVYKTKLDSPFLSSVTVINETNSTLMESYDNAPLCYQCSDSLDNETLCLAVQSDESLTIPTVGCFLSTELPCYRRPHHNAFKSSTNMTVSLIGVTITIIVIAVVAGYLIIHKRRKATSVNFQTISLNEAETDALIVAQR